MSNDDVATQKPTSEEKIAFVQNLPHDMSPATIVKMAADKGIEISRSYVAFARRKGAVDSRESRAASQGEAATKAPAKNAAKWTGTKREFILDRPQMKAAEIVADGRAHGLKLHPHSIHTVRSMAKAATSKGRKTMGRTAKTVVRKKGPKPKAALVPLAAQNGAAASEAHGQSSPRSGGPTKTIAVSAARAIAGNGAAGVDARLLSRREAEALFAQAVRELGLLRIEELVAELRG